jgi:heme-degrading monooxygenase HmoA
MKRTTIIITFALTACADEETAPDDTEPTLEQRLEELATCEPTDLEMLLPWMGPAFDPMTGQLVEPLPEGHVEAVVNGWRRYDEASTMLRMDQGAAVAGDVFARDGLLGFSSVESVECDISISHTLWRDEAAMFAFVLGDAHTYAMSRAHEMHFEAVGAHWDGEARDTPPTWREGIDRMVQELREE